MTPGWSSPPPPSLSSLFFSLSPLTLLLARWVSHATCAGKLQISGFAQMVGVPELCPPQRQLFPCGPSGSHTLYPSEHKQLPLPRTASCLSCSTYEELGHLSEPVWKLPGKLSLDANTLTFPSLDPHSPRQKFPRS